MTRTTQELLDELRRGKPGDAERNKAILAECRKNLIKHKIFEPKPVVKELQAAGIIGPGTEIIEGVTAYHFLDSKQTKE